MEEYEEIDIRELLHIILEKWWVIALFTVIAVAVSAYVTIEMIDPVYEAKSTLFIGNESDSIAGISFSDLQVDDQLVVDYQELIKTRLVTEEVILALNLPTTVDKFVEQLSVSGIKDSRFMHIVFQDTDPQLAARIANELSDSLVSNAESIVGVENVVVVDTAVPPEQPISPNLLMNVAISAVLGAMLGMFLIMVLHMMDNTFKREDDIERQLGISVLGVVPKFEGERRAS
jgi:capsular polysaccharide biosynthesis protein